MRWSAEKINDWQRHRHWLIGCNYTPRNAINQLEMWQKETFSPDIIREELAWAASIGFNSIRLFLHDLVWQSDKSKFIDRIDTVLEIAARNRIGVVPVFFDSVWHPFPHPGKQNHPEPGVHNSGWVQSPGVAILRDEIKFNTLRSYITTIIRTFAKDARIDLWDLWNEPDNSNPMSYGPRDLGEGKGIIIAKYLPLVFQWARSAKPTQPLTCGIWLGDWTSDETLKPHERIQVDLSDAISFHNYGPADDIERRIKQLKRFHRPLLCTEYMSRGSGSTFHDILPLLKLHKVGAYNWGFVRGKTQTHFPWDSWQHPYEHEPRPWFHDIFYEDGTPYRKEEIKLICSLTGGKNHLAKLSRIKAKPAAPMKRRGRTKPRSRSTRKSK